MLKKIKNIVTVIASLAVLAAPTLAPAVVAADANIQGALCSGTTFDVTGSGTKSDCNDQGNTGGINQLLKKIVNVFSAIVGVVAVIMIIVGGLRYITSGGESGNVSTAKNTLIYAIVGLVIVALAQLIVHYVLTQANSLGGSS